MREQELQGNISINEYSEVAEGYSVHESTKAFLEEWARANAEENAEITQDNAERVADVCKVKVCKNGNLFIGCYDEQKTAYVNFFIRPAVAIEIGPKNLVQPEFTTTPQGRKVQTGWNWVAEEVLQDAWKGLKVVYNGKDILEVF